MEAARHDDSGCQSARSCPKDNDASDPFHEEGLLDRQEKVYAVMKGKEECHQFPNFTKLPMPAKEQEYTSCSDIVGELRQIRL